MNPKFKHWLTEQKYAKNMGRWRTDIGWAPNTWMIHKVKQTISKYDTKYIKYSWGDIKRATE